MFDLQPPRHISNSTLGVFRCGAQNCDEIGGIADIDRPPGPDRLGGL